MKILENFLADRPFILDSVKKFGYTPDHNFDWFLYCADEGKPRIFYWDDGSTLWGYDNSKKGEWLFFSDPLMPQLGRDEKIKEVIGNIFSNDNIKKITILDVREDIRDIFIAIEAGKFTSYYETIWPVMDMEKYDPSLPGGHFKELRNARNKFYRENRVEIVTTEKIEKKLMHSLVDRWYANRLNKIEEIFPGRYHNIIDGGFAGTKGSRAMIVNGNVVGFNAGWDTPNSNSDYSATIGIHDFSVKDLGAALLLEDLEWIKKAGYKTADLEATDEQALKFKMQFHPYKTYKTYTFYLYKK